MPIQRRYLPPMLLAVTVASSIATAPTALAGQSCTYVGANSTVCQSPGNVQVINTPPPVQYGPQYPFFGDNAFGDNAIILHHHR